MWPFQKSEAGRAKEKVQDVSHAGKTYIGKVNVEIVITRSIDKHQFKSNVPIAFFLNEENQRSIGIVASDPNVVEFIKQYDCNDWNEACVWELGGPFPKKFEPAGDVLGEMLTRMIDAKLTGKS